MERADMQVVQAVIKPAGYVVTCSGEVEAHGPHGVRYLSVGDAVYEGEEIITGEGERVEVEFLDQTVLSQGPESHIALDDYHYDQHDAGNSIISLQMVQGIFRTVTGKIAADHPGNLKMYSPWLAIGVRGTTTVHEIGEDYEKHGAEFIHGRSLVLEHESGEMRLITAPRLMVEADASGLSEVREFTPEELEQFQSLSPFTMNNPDFVDPDLLQDGQYLADLAGEDGDAADGPGYEEVLAREPSQGPVVVWDQVDGAAADQAGSGDAGSLYLSDADADPASLSLVDSGPAPGFGTLNYVYLPESRGPAYVNGRLLISGDAYDNTLNGTDADDHIQGLAGNDTLWGGAGDDHFVGGDGVDTVTYWDNDNGIIADFSRGEIIGGSVDTVESVENLVGSAWADQMTGSAGANDFQGLAGDDTISGLGGNDVLRGGAGADTLSGGTGDDTLYGGADNDHLSGDGGNDLLAGGSGDDVLDGGAGIDTADFSGASAGMFVNLATGSASGEGADTLTSVENVAGSAYSDSMMGDAGANVLAGNSGDDTIMGNAGDDTLSGGAGADTLSGGTGADTLLGGSGDDTLAGGAGNDHLDGGAGLDYVDYSSAPVMDIDLSAHTVFDGTDTDAIYNIEKIDTGAGNDLLRGDAADNIFFAGGGNDVLAGGAGADSLLGGSGADVFYYGDPGDGSRQAANGPAAGSWDTLDFSSLDGDDIQVLDTAFGNLGLGSLIDGDTFTNDLGGTTTEYDGTNATGSTAWSSGTASFIVDYDGTDYRLIYDPNGAGAGFDVLTNLGGGTIAATDVTVVDTAPV